MHCSLVTCVPAELAATACALAGLHPCAINSSSLIPPVQVLPGLARLLAAGAHVAPQQDVHILAQLAELGGSQGQGQAGDLAGTAQALADWAAGHGPTSGSHSSSTAPGAVVPLQERLLQLGVAARDLASLAVLGSEAW